jgi:hypothetical protein
MALVELLRIGALASRNVWHKADGTSTTVYYNWTELGFRLMEAWSTASVARINEMRARTRQIPEGGLPPPEFHRWPEGFDPDKKPEK